MGYSSQPYQNPMQLHDDQGWGVPFTQHPTFMAPIFLNVESARRDTSIYTSAVSFRLHLPHKLEGVRSIEVVELTVPSVGGGLDEPVDSYFFLYNGLVDNPAAPTPSFSSQNIVGLYETMQMDRPPLYNAQNTIPNNPTFTIKPSPATLTADPSSRPGAGAFPTPYPHPDFGAHSFGKFPYISSAPVQIWERTNWRRVHYFKPELNKLDYLDFTLVDRAGVLYNLNGAEWSATLMVTARSK